MNMRHNLVEEVKDKREVAHAKALKNKVKKDYLPIHEKSEKVNNFRKEI